MRRPCMRGTPRWPFIADERRPRRVTGSISVMAVFLYLLFTIIGLGLIAVSQLYTKFSGLKKDLSLLGFAAESGIKLGYESLAGRLGAVSGPVLLPDEEVLALKTDSEAGGDAVITRLAGSADSLSGKGGDGDQAWEFALRFSGGRSTAHDGFFVSDSRGSVDSTGTIAHRLPRKKASLEFSLRAAAGRIPLFLFPFLIAADPDPEKEDFLRSDPNLTFAGAAKSDVRPGVAFAEASVLPSDPEPLLKKALQIKLFSPDRLTRAEVRSALGLEMVDEPVPEGVYLVRNTNGLGGVYVQGDLRQIILAVENGWQDIFFFQAENAWCLKFKPAPGSTVFGSPSGTEEFDRAPLGIIMVAGKVQSLGGGTVDAAGIPALQTGDPVPSVLRGVSLTIVATEEIEISSHLVQEGVRWTDSIPYLKDSTSQLSVWAGGNLTMNSAARELHVQASLTSGKKIALAGSGKSAVVAGGLQARAFELGPNRMTIVPDGRVLSTERMPGDVPRTAVPLLLILALRPIQWND
jgi:hypothetical protein